MAAYVRVRNTDELRDAIAQTGDTQTVVAAKAGVSLQRLNQLCTGVAPTIRAGHAARIEEVLGVTRGTLFAVEEAELIKSYLDSDNPYPTPAIPALDDCPTRPIP